MMYRPCKNPDCHNLVKGGGAKLYCSNACRQKVYRKAHAKPFDRTRGQDIRFCENCGKRFVTSQPYARFCKTSCRVSFWQQMKRIDQKALEGK